MKFATYIYNKVEEVGVISSNRVIPLREIMSTINMKAPKNMNEFIELADDNLIEKLKEHINKNNYQGIEMKDIKLSPPIPYPRRNIICLGKNYLDHAKETSGVPGGTDDIPKFPIYFTKIANPAIGNGDIIKRHSDITDSLDYEVELAVIIGKDGINIKKEEAGDYIFGYTIINDVSARNIQMKHGQWFKGKSLDTHCPMGPYIVHKSEIPLPLELDIKCRVNGELRQNSNTKEFIFDIPHIISDLSKGMKLIAGDIIITGTPAGVGLGFKPNKFLNSGDVVECCIEKIGTLTNKIE